MVLWARFFNVFVSTNPLINLYIAITSPVKCQWKIRICVALRQFSNNRWKVTLKYVQNKKVAHDAQLRVSLMLLPHFEVFWNLLDLYDTNCKILLVVYILMRSVIYWLTLTRSKISSICFMKWISKSFSCWRHLCICSSVDHM